MKSGIISQVLYDMKHQPVIGTVTLLGTAISIFLIMTIVMMTNIRTEPFAPESNRPRILYGIFMNIGYDNGGESSASMKYSLAKRLFGDLTGSDAVTYYQDASTTDVMVKGKAAAEQYIRKVDDNFWKVFDFEFIAGRPFDRDEFEAGLKVCVINRSIASRMYGNEDPIGREVFISQIPFKVIGVVNDVSVLAEEAFGEVFYPFTVNNEQNISWGDSEYFGPYRAAILAASRGEFDNIRDQVKARKAVFDKELKEDNMFLRDHGSPFTQEEKIYVYGSNTDLDKSGERINYILFALLLIIPAINLSSMTQSRIRRRMSETGVRRAFGCSRNRVIADILTENFVLTLAGGLVGLLFTIIFGLFFSEFIFTDNRLNASFNITLEMLLNWKLFGSALIFCFILNLLSSGIPAWRASRVNPVIAINSRNI